MCVFLFEGGGVVFLFFVYWFCFLLFHGKRSKFPLGRPQRGEGVVSSRGREKETLGRGGGDREKKEKRKKEKKSSVFTKDNAVVEHITEQHRR